MIIFMTTDGRHVAASPVEVARIEDPGFEVEGSLVTFTDGGNVLVKGEVFDLAIALAAALGVEPVVCHDEGDREQPEDVEQPPPGS